MSQNYVYPASSTVTIAAVGTNGAPAPAQSIEIAGVSGGNLTPVSVDNSGNVNVNTVSSTLPPGAATSANQATELTRLAGSLVPTAYNEVDLTYIVAGNGTGQVGTAVYKLASSTVKTLTLTYDASNRLSSVVAS
jgi:hypothetical protein